PAGWWRVMSANSSARRNSVRWRQALVGKGAQARLLDLAQQLIEQLAPVFRYIVEQFGHPFLIGRLHAAEALPASGCEPDDAAAPVGLHLDALDQAVALE